MPQAIGDNRFGNWLSNARDWNVSRNRYWGTPIPLWVSDDYEEVCRPISHVNLCSPPVMLQIVAIGSIAQLEELSGVKDIKDLHRESVDHITIPSKRGKGTLHRIEEVFDCWFESGRYAGFFVNLIDAGSSLLRHIFQHAIRATTLSVRKQGEIPCHFPRRFRFGGNRSDSRVVLHHACCLHAPVRYCALEESHCLWFGASGVSTIPSPW